VNCNEIDSCGEEMSNFVIALEGTFPFEVQEPQKCAWIREQMVYTLLVIWSPFS